MQSKEEERLKRRNYNQRPEVKAKKKAYEQMEEVKERARNYNQRPEVKIITKARKKAYNQSPEVKARRKIYMKNYRKQPGVKAKARDYRDRPEVVERIRKFRDNPENKEIKKKYNQHPQAKEKNREWRLNPKNIKRVAKAKKERMKSDSDFRTIVLLRDRFYQALKRYTKTGRDPNIRTSKQYGINYKLIIEHLKPFPVDMHLYHIDHIRPLCSFDFINEDGSTNEEQIKEAFSPENHQFLLAHDNLSKGGKWGL